MAKLRLYIRSVIDLASRGICATGRFIRHAIPRLYGLGMLLIICGLTFMSVRYLVRSLMVPTKTPEQITGLPKRMSPELLNTQRVDWKAIAAAETPRVPPAHYHRVDSWIEPDTFNDCSRSGCHGPLPHARNKAVRAFLNMHATSMHCGVCHLQTDHQPLHMTWYDLETGNARKPPAILQLYALLMAFDVENKDKNELERQHQELVALIKRSADDLPDGNALDHLVEHFEAIRPGSRTYPSLLDQTKAAIPRYFRGEYGAKLALIDEDGHPMLAHPDSAIAVDRFLAEGAHLQAEERVKLLEKVHPRRRQDAYTCTECHRADASLIALQDLGYPSARINQLSDPIVFQMIENIDAGRTFEMPRFLAPHSDD